MPHQKLQSKDLKLTIGLVIDDSLDRPAGVQQYVLIVGEWLRSRGHEVYYLAGATTRSDLKNVYSLSRNIGVRFNGNQMRIPLISSRRQIHRLLNQVHFDVLHVQMPIARCWRQESSMTRITIQPSSVHFTLFQNTRWLLLPATSFPGYVSTPKDDSTKWLVFRRPLKILPVGHFISIALFCQCH